MSQDSDARKPPPGFGRWLTVFSPRNSEQNKTPESSNNLSDANGDSKRRHSAPVPTPKRKHVETKYNLQPSSWNSPVVNQRIIQTKQGENGVHRLSTNAIIPRTQPSLGVTETKPSTTPAGRRQIRVKHPSVFLSSPIVKSTLVLSEKTKLQWNELSEKSSFLQPRSDDDKYVGFKKGEIMSSASRLYAKNVITKRPHPFDEPAAEIHDTDELKSSSPKTKRLRVSFDTDNSGYRGRNETQTIIADGAIRMYSEAKTAESLKDDDELPFTAILSKPIMLHDYKGFRDGRVLIYSDPLDDYKNMKKAAPTCSSAKVEPQDEPEDWECSHCGTMNPHDESTCKGCSKSRSNKSDATGWGNIFSSLKHTWKCPRCTTRNKMEATKCAACEEDRPVVSTDSIANESQKTVSNNGASASFNAANLVAGTTTTTSDSVSQQPFSFGSGETKVVESKSEPSKFRFGISTTSSNSASTPQTSFGNAPSDASAKPAFSLGSAPAPSDTSKPQSFSFGSAPAPSEPSPKPSSFSFGTAPATSEPSSTSLQPEPSLKPSSFSFGTGSTPVPSDASSKPLPFSFGTGGTPAPSEPSSKTPSFAFGTSSTPAPSEPSSKVPSFAFGSSSTPASSKASPKAPSFAFGEETAVKGAGDGTVSLRDNKDKTSAAAATTAPFSFGSTPSSGDLNQTSDAVENSSSIAASSNGSFVQQKSESQPFVFGATGDKDGDSERKRSKPSFSLGGEEKLPSLPEHPSFGSTEPPKPSDEKGVPFSSNPPFNSGSSFDQTKKNENNSTSSGFVFGSSQQTLPTNANSSGPTAGFGQQFGTTGPSSTFSSGFGATPAPTGTAANTNGPTFGSTGSESNGFGASSTLPVFGNAAQGPATFGAPAPPPTFGTPASGFDASTAAASFGATPAPSFGVQPAPALANTAPMFNAASNQSSAAPPFGNPTFGAPNPFGTSAPAPGSFGMTPAPAPSATAFGGFTSAPPSNFGQPAQAPSFGAPAAANSFGQPAQPPPSFGAPGFGGSAPSFGGAGAADVAFTMGSGGGPKRRIVRVKRR